MNILRTIWVSSPLFVHTKLIQSAGLISSTLLFVSNVYFLSKSKLSKLTAISHWSVMIVSNTTFQNSIFSRQLYQKLQCVVATIAFNYRCSPLHFFFVSYILSKHKSTNQSNKSNWRQDKGAPFEERWNYENAR